MICKNCGSKIVDTAKTCGYCGYRIRKESYSDDYDYDPEKESRTSGVGKPLRMIAVAIIGIGIGIIAFLAYLFLTGGFGGDADGRVELMESYSLTHDEFHDKYIDDIYACVNGSNGITCTSERGFSATFYNQQLYMFALNLYCTDYKLNGFYIGMSKEEADANAEKLGYHAVHRENLDMDDISGEYDDIYTKYSNAYAVMYWPSDGPAYNDDYMTDPSAMPNGVDFHAVIYSDNEAMQVVFYDTDVMKKMYEAYNTERNFDEGYYYDESDSEDVSENEEYES